MIWGQERGHHPVELLKAVDTPDLEPESALTEAPGLRGNTNSGEAFSGCIHSLWGHKGPGRWLPLHLPLHRGAGETAHPRRHHYLGPGRHLARTHYHPGPVSMSTTTCLSSDHHMSSPTPSEGKYSSGPPVPNYKYEQTTL